jgi:hypothetical protein
MCTPWRRIFVKRWGWAHEEAAGELAGIDLGDERLNRRRTPRAPVAAGRRRGDTTPRTSNGPSSAWKNTPGRVLCLEDTTETDYTGNSDMQGLGPLNYENRQGLYLHPIVAVTADRASRFLPRHKLLAATVS